MNAFDQLAPAYDVKWTNSRHGRAQRDVVWREIDRLFHPGERVLDLGCGTGEDAVHLASLGIEVRALDASAEMVRIATGRGVNAELFDIENLNKIEGIYDGAISNFGALNCIADLASVGTALARLIRPAGFVAICIMPRLAWAEVLRFNFRRWFPNIVWRGMRVHYPTARQIARAFPAFRLVRRRSIAWSDHCLFVFEKLEAKGR